MSEESFFTRWSKRKAAANAEPVPEPARVEEAAAEAQPQPAPEQPAEEVDLSLLPPLEEITAATDITGFLKPGVPEALRTAALRKVWTRDPAIRDFIGLSENAWDFNDPAGIPGFGPIDMPGGQIRQMAAKVVGDVREAAEKVEGALEKVAARCEGENLQTAEAESPNPPAIDAATQHNLAVAPQQTDSARAEQRPRSRSDGSPLPR
jgi:Protein of unknown function (DUF3306)